MDVFIDTAVKGCNIALFDDLSILVMAQEEIERGHAETLLPLYERLIHQIEKSVNDIDNIYVTIGPGSFTGLRVGLTVARFIGFSLGKPVHGITTFQAFSSAVEDDKNRLILVETKRSDYYCQLLDSSHMPLGEAQSIPCNDIKTIIDAQGSVLVTGDAVGRFVSETGMAGIPIISQPMINIEKTVQAIQKNMFSIHPADAFYIREADVSTPKKPGIAQSV